MENWQRYQPGVDLSTPSEHSVGSSSGKIGEKSGHDHDLERTKTGDDIARTATGQAQIGADDELPPIELKTFIACLAISFLWTGSQIPLYMLLVCIDYTLADIGGATIQIWYVLGPITALAATAPIAGSLSDIFGRRWTILIGGMFLVTGLILIGTSQSPTLNIVSFPFTGIGAALLEINALAAVNEIAPNKLRGFYTSILTWTIVPFFPLGVYSFNLSVHATWRWNVWIPLIWAGIGVVMTFIFYHPPPRIYHGHTETIYEKLLRIDWLGFFLSLSGTVLFLFGLGAGGYTAPWKSALVIVPLIIGFFLLVGLGYWETWARHPLYPPGMFKNTRVFVLTLIITAVAGANFFSILILWPKYVVAVFQLGPTHAGLLIMAQTAGVLFGAGFFSYTITRFQGSIRPQMILSCSLMMAGLGALPAVSYTNTTLAGFLVVIGCVGIGGIIIPASVITQLCTPDEYLGTVTALTFVARVLGGAIGFTIYYYILNYDLTRAFESYATGNKQALAVVTLLLSHGFGVETATSFLRSLAISDTKTLLATPGVTQEYLDQISQLARPIWVIGFHNLWLTTIAFSGVGLICSVFLGDIKKYMTNHRAVQL